jgi:FkbM family methyltransferase
MTFCISKNIGAHVGFFAIPASLKARLVVAVEPSAQNFCFLARNVELNERKNVVLVNQALSNYEGTGYLSGTNDAGHLSADEGNEVKVTTIDALLRKLKISSFDVMKMDIEGAEAQALSGLFLRDLNEIALEAHGKKNEEQVKAILESSGFSVKVWEFSMVDTLSKVVKHLEDIFIAECKTKFVSRFALKQWIATRCFHIRHVNPESYRRILLGSRVGNPL